MGSAVLYPRPFTPNLATFLESLWVFRGVFFCFDCSHRTECEGGDSGGDQGRSYGDGRTSGFFRIMPFQLFLGHVLLLRFPHFLCEPDAASSTCASLGPGHAPGLACVQPVKQDCVGFASGISPPCRAPDFLNPCPNASAAGIMNRELCHS